MRASRRSTLSTLITILVLLAASTNFAAAQQRPGQLTIHSVTLTGFQVVNNTLQAVGTVTGTLAGAPFSTPALFNLQQAAPTSGQCSVLNLALAPIHISLLGLHVDTSAICLNITASQNGGLLGNLLCSLAGGGIPTPLQVNQLQNGLTTILNGALRNSPTAPQNASAVCTGQCSILDLVLGPVNLSLLGLNVSLDNCASGPVEVCVSATASEGLLGNLLCGLTNTQLLNITLADIARLVQQILATGHL